VVVVIAKGVHLKRCRRVPILEMVVVLMKSSSTTHCLHFAGTVVAALVVRRGSTISNRGLTEEGMGGEEGEDNLNMNSVVAARRGGGVGLGD